MRASVATTTKTAATDGIVKLCVIAYLNPGAASLIHINMIFIFDRPYCAAPIT